MPLDGKEMQAGLVMPISLFNKDIFPIIGRVIGYTSTINLPPNIYVNLLEYIAEKIQIK